MSKELVTQEVDEKALAIFAGVEEEEHLSQDELALPFLKLAQKGTAQVDEDSPNYINGLKPGQFFNNATSKIYGDTIEVQVHGYFRNFTIWKGPKGSGDFQGVMTPEEFAEFERTNNLERDGGDFVQEVDGESLRYTDTRNFLVVLADHVDDGILLYTMSSTGIKPSKTWNTLNNGRRINGRKAPRFATLWELKTDGFKKNDYTYKQVSSIKPVGWVGEDLAKLGIELKELVDSIKATSGEAAHSANGGEDSESDADESAF